MYIKSIMHHNQVICTLRMDNNIWKSINVIYRVVVVHLPSRVRLFATPWPAALWASLSLIISQSLPKFMFIALVMLSSNLILWHPSSDTLFSCPQSLSASGTFPMSQLFASDDQNTGVSASTSVLPRSIQGWFPLRLTGLISLLSKELSGVSSSTTVQKHQFFGTLPSVPSSSHNCTWPLGRPKTRLHGPLSAE